MLVTSILAAAMLQTPAVSAQRKEFVACLDAAVESAKAQKLAADQFKAHVGQACGAVEGKLKSELAGFGRKNGLTKSVADEDAQMQIDDYLYTADERYRYEVEASAPAAPK